MFRWSLLLTRTAILLLIAAAIWIGRDVVIRMAIVDAVQSTTGAKVDIEQVHSSFNDRKVFLNRVAVADPRNPMRNLFQADTAVIKFDIDRLLHRKVHIDECSTSRFVFGSPRSVSGTLSSVSPDTETSVPVSEIPIHLAESDPRQEWLDSFEYSASIENPGQLEINQATQNLIENLNEDINRQVAKIDFLRTEIREIHDDSQAFSNNYLRPEKIESAQQRLNSLRNSIGNIANTLAELDRQVAENQNSIVDAKSKDELRIRNRALQQKIDGGTVSRLLLNDNQIEQAREVLQWYLAFRDAIPDPSADFHGIRTNGKNAIVPVLANSPAFLVKSMQIDGAGRLEGRKFNFTGNAKNISTEPHLVNSPTTFTLRAQGNTHFVVDCVLDRREQTPRDVISMVCPDLPIGSRVLGDSEMLRVKVSPCRSKINISLQCQDETLTGNLNFDYDNLVVQIENLDELAGGKEVADLINLDLASVTNYNVNANISGPLSGPTISFDSNLGNQLASKFNAVVERKTQLALRRLDETTDQHLIRLNQQISEKIRLASQRLEQDIIPNEIRLTADLNNLLPDKPADRQNKLR